MDLTEQIRALPKPRRGYVRAIRVEAKCEPTLGVSMSYIHRSHWSSLPNPYEEADKAGDRRWEFGEGAVCATRPSQFHTWFKPQHLEADALGKTHVVALDVPVEACQKFPKQLVIMRHLAKQVAVLLQ